jgi:hypothetical protein
MSDALYDTDVFAWSEQQADLLLRAIGLSAIYDDALAGVRAGEVAGASGRPLPPTCKFTLEELLGKPSDLTLLLAPLAAATAA